MVLPATWDLVRRAVDAGAAPGQFLLTGSASGPRTGAHSGAGRIVRVRMRPMSLHERASAYAAATATSASYEKVRDAATSGQGDKPARSTTQPYRDTLEALYIVDSLPAWTPSNSHIAELGESPKHHLVDPALATTLLGLGAGALLRGESGETSIPRDGTFLGALFESLVTLNVRVFAQGREATVQHLRTHRDQHEVDLIVERDDRRIVAIEVKLSATIDDHDVRNLRWLGERIGEDLLDAVIVTTGRAAYRRSDGIAAVPAALLGP